MALRLLMLARDEGVVRVEITDDLELTDIASHWKAVFRYLRTGDDTALGLLEGAGVGLYEFETDPDEIDFRVHLTAIHSWRRELDD